MWIWKCLSLSQGLVALTLSFESLHVTKSFFREKICPFCQGSCWHSQHEPRNPVQKVVVLKYCLQCKFTTCYSSVFTDLRCCQRYIEIYIYLSIYLFMYLILIYVLIYCIWAWSGLHKLTRRHAQMGPWFASQHQLTLKKYSSPLIPPIWQSNLCLSADLKEVQKCSAAKQSIIV